MIAACVASYAPDLTIQGNVIQKIMIQMLSVKCCDMKRLN